MRVGRLTPCSRRRLAASAWTGGELPRVPVILAGTPCAVRLWRGQDLNLRPLGYAAGVGHGQDFTVVGRDFVGYRTFG